jgi:hypothetical protein
MKKIALILAGVTLLGLNACKKENDPKITINDPKKAEYEVGDTAFVNVVVTDEDELHEAKAWFITRPQNDTLWTIKRHSHDKTINLVSYYVIDSLPEEQKVDFEVKVENEAGRVSTAKYSFEVHDH